MSQTFDPASHDRLLRVAARIDFPAQYRAFCRRFSTYDPGGRPFDMKEAERLFREHGPKVERDKQLKMIFFEKEEIAGWRWEASLRILNYNGLEPLITSDTLDCNQGAGSTWFSVAREAGAYLTPPLAPQDFLPPILAHNRPAFDGRPETLKRLVPDLVTLFRFLKQGLHEHWDTTVGEAKVI